MSIVEHRLRQEKVRFTHPLAFFTEGSRGRRHPERPDPIRLAFERDAHRILHAKPFRRLRNKTQVFFSPENDHIATRMDHSLYVATISSTICRALGLNDDLAFAIALGHDLGHAPFGHSGERVLRGLLNRDRPIGSPDVDYTHEAQSLRVVDLLSGVAGRDFTGLNLLYEVRDGIRCHCGEATGASSVPRSAADDRDPGTFQGRGTAPITLEGCVVRMADRIAYLGRDYEDAQTAIGLALPPLPQSIEEVLGHDNRDIINRLVRDLIEENQRDPSSISFSTELHDVALALRSFNYTHIYGHRKLEEYRSKADDILVRIYDVLFRHLVGQSPDLWGVVDPEDPPHVRALAHFIAGARYGELPEASRVVVDFISLMTDGFAFKTFESIVFPRPLV